MNFYHFRPPCKVIKRSRRNKGPFLPNYEDDEVQEIVKNEDTYVTNGRLNLEHFGVEFCFSRKAFIGGLPLDITEDDLIKRFSTFGPLIVDWPYKEDTNSVVPPKGFVFLLFQKDFAVDDLIQSCVQKNYGYFLPISSEKIRNKQVQVRPWKIYGIDHIFGQANEINSRNTIFVGGVPRTLDAEQLGNLMALFFGKVSYVGIDTDAEYLYPKGSARVIFENKASVVAAVKKRFVMPAETNSRKMMEIKSYVLSDQFCDKCNDNNNVDEKCSALFCPEVECLFYLCEFCWVEVHSSSENLKNHKPMVRQGLDDYMNSLKKRGLVLK